MTAMHPRIDQIEALARHEEAIGNLYAAYAEKLPEHEEFWTDLSREEMDHASWVREFRKKVEEGVSEIREGRFRVPAIETSIQYVNGYAQDARTRQISLLGALSIAADLENALLEKDFLDVYETDDEELKNMLNSLRNATAAHRQKVNDLLTDIRQMQGPAIG